MPSGRSLKPVKRTFEYSLVTKGRISSVPANCATPVMSVRRRIIHYWFYLCEPFLPNCMLDSLFDGLELLLIGVAPIRHVSVPGLV